MLFRSRAHELGVAPRVRAAELDGPGNYDKVNRMGRMAMDAAEGMTIGARQTPEVEKAYWEARATLHRGGIAHNDMHVENVFVDSKGKGRFVDFGLAQDNPKAALAEAMGVFSKTPQGTVRTLGPERGGDGDWQVRRWQNLGGRALIDADLDGDPGSIASLKRFQIGRAHV